MEYYWHKVLNSMNEIVDFLNQNNIKKEDIVAIVPVHSEGFLLYELVYVENLIEGE